MPKPEDPKLIPPEAAAERVMYLARGKNGIDSLHFKSPKLDERSGNFVSDGSALSSIGGRGTIGAIARHYELNRGQVVKLVEQRTK